MPHTLQLRLPDDVYKRLARRAEATGHPPEALATDWLASVTQAAADEDPLESFIGAFASSVPDGADQHDRYLGAPLSPSDE